MARRPAFLALDRADRFFQLTQHVIREFVAGQAREALRSGGPCADRLKQELNRRLGRLGLRVIRCSLLAS